MTTPNLHGPGSLPPGPSQPSQRRSGALWVLLLAVLLGLGVGVGAGFFYLRDDGLAADTAASSSTSVPTTDIEDLTTASSAMTVSSEPATGRPTTVPPATAAALTRLPPTIASDVDGPDLEALAAAFDRRVAGINTGFYDQAYLVLSPRMRENITSDAFADGNSTSLITNFVIRSIEVADPNTRQVLITMTSQQDAEWGYEGQTCTDWNIDYRMVRIGIDWHIDGAENVNTPSAC